MSSSSSLSSISYLRRSPNGILGGVCQGLGEHFGISPNIMRLIWVVSALLAGTGVLFYLVLWWIMPSADTEDSDYWQLSGQATPMRRPDSHKNSQDRKIFGVAAALARRFGIDPTYIRLLALALLFASGPAIGIVYLGATLFIPEDNPHSFKNAASR